MEDASSSLVLSDTPRAGIRRLTLNRPEKAQRAF